MHFQPLNRRDLFKKSALVGAGALVASTATAHTSKPDMLTVAGKGRPSVMAKDEIQLDLDRLAIYQIDLESVDPDAIILSARGKRATLSEFLKASMENGLKLDEVFSGTIAITGSPFNFPNISAEVSNEIFERPVLAASSGTAYWCALLAYGCHHY